MKLFRTLLGTTSHHILVWQAALSSCDGLGDHLPPVTVSGAQLDGAGDPRLLTTFSHLTTPGLRVLSQESQLSL